MDFILHYLAKIYLISSQRWAILLVSWYFSGVFCVGDNTDFLKIFFLLQIILQYSGFLNLVLKQASSFSLKVNVFLEKK